MRTTTIASILFILLLASVCQGAPINCAQSTVQSAINAAKDGDSIVITGTCTWITPVTINNKQLIIIGDASSPPVITDGLSSHGYQQALLSITDQNKPIRISNMTFNMGVGTATNGLIYLKGNTSSFRIDHVTFNSGSGGGRLIYIITAYGVIDHNTFNVTHTATIQGVTVFGPDQIAWTTPLTLGTANAVYIEVNTFNYVSLNDGALDAYEGARYVFRYNTIVGTNFGHHGLDSGGHASPVSFEIYNNTSTSPHNVFLGNNIRGGTGVIFNNSWDSNFSASIYASYYRSCCDCLGPGCSIATAGNCSAGLVSPDLTGYVTDAPSPHGWGRCNGTNPLDINSDATGWPCAQQPGTSNNNGTIISMPIYQWLNTKGGVNSTMVPNPAFTCSSPGISDQIKENRDYYSYTATFNGTTGVGSGLLSNRPSTCTQGVGYFASDDGSQGTLYKCTSANTWSKYYTPYTYPHPLRTKTPNAPVYLRVE